ncbi:MAG: glycosyltransferase [Oscillospiraceae bacterium]|nr:glycosyltransferase [Oscillospiraceae bacterium]
MKILFINSVCGIRSTGRICTDLAEKYIKQGHDVRIAYGRESVPEKYKDIAVRIGKKADVYFSGFCSRVFDNEGFNSVRATKEFLAWAEKYDPDMLWLHNLHGYYINIKMLFDWIKSRPDMQVKWTLHDCWAFTGHCPHFSFVKCEQWKKGCTRCCQKHGYPKSIFFDNSKTNYEKKKKTFCCVKKMTIIVPSYWLADLVKQSFLRDYPVEVIHNTIDTSVYKPTPSNFRKRYGLEDKIIVLGVASAWSKAKGLDDFIELSKMLDCKYKIVLVGIPPKMKKRLPQNIITISRTNNTVELAEIYTAADIFVNPSKEETFGLTTLEAVSCGTEAIVYKNTACEEVIDLCGNGVAIDVSQQALLDEIKARTEVKKDFKKELNGVSKK